MAAASSPLLLRRLLSRRSMTAPSRIFHTNAAKARGLVEPEVQFNFKVPGVEQTQTAEGLNLVIDMPGMSKEDVEFTVEDNTLVVKGEDKNEFWHEVGEEGSWCNKFQYPYEKIYNMKAIKAEMKNGVLKVFLPKIKDEDDMNIKIKDEERSHVFKVNVE